MYINIISLILLYYLKMPLGLNTVSEEWKRIFNGGMIASVALLALEALNIPLLDYLFSALSYILAALIVYVSLRNPELHHRKGLIYAWLPIMGVLLLTDLTEFISESLYQSLEGYFGTVKVFALIWAIAMWINNTKQRKALELERRKTEEKEKEYKITEAIKEQLEIQVAERTAEIMRQKEELVVALEELKAAQEQLIHAEKMASLGELTAGIAHEIQNPLNFVNNFSEVSTELLQEMKVELREGNSEEALEIAEDVIENLGKIAHHGKRADSIVKGMLQHSRANAGQKEETDINLLADEYLRLSYHGLRAKDKAFTADFKLDLDPNLPKIEVIPQDLGRVLLNLINNAFYAAAEKKSMLTEAKTNTSTFIPTVTVTTKKLKKGIEIRVRDNGNGISEEIRSKIFQPFFTTKPTGKGTGLGLSMSYEIITKGHGGQLNLESKPGEYTEFIIILP
ncbi:ATP-binding protein [Algoriphagus sp. CAU 1675]|uniref:sensor histidine kinase n=1 Tax=Algoriphagus sp. CAU 1675 TaxID=3032597 RepID=UPI0023DC7BFC|nr:ATP-binding protein [Algoriphagus sp. CAU 1675]MDF2156736.1 ATP-binding protein [Algoriphagus sp. CAU 1675]